MQKINQKGFTLLEILLVIALIAILAAIVIVAINPAKQLADGRNAQRRSDVNTILNAVYQYSIDNNGAFPRTIASVLSCPTACSTSSEICETGTCAGGIDLATTLTTGGKYIVSLPMDPNQPSGSTLTGYYICKDSTSSRITVCAPSAENGATITVTR